MSLLGFAGALGCRYPPGTGIHVQLPAGPFERDRRAVFLPGRGTAPRMGNGRTGGAQGRGLHLRGVMCLREGCCKQGDPSGQPFAELLKGRLAQGTTSGGSAGAGCVRLGDLLRHFIWGVRGYPGAHVPLLPVRSSQSKELCYQLCWQQKSKNSWRSPCHRPSGPSPIQKSLDPRGRSEPLLPCELQNKMQSYLFVSSWGSLRICVQISSRVQKIGTNAWSCVAQAHGVT